MFRQCCALRKRQLRATYVFYCLIDSRAEAMLMGLPQRLLRTSKACHGESSGRRWLATWGGLACTKCTWNARWSVASDGPRIATLCRSTTHCGSRKLSRQAFSAIAILCDSPLTEQLLVECFNVFEMLIYCAKDNELSCYYNFEVIKQLNYSI